MELLYYLFAFFTAYEKLTVAVKASVKHVLGPFTVTFLVDLPVYITDSVVSGV